jgi:hypothetical protein
MYSYCIDLLSWLSPFADGCGLKKFNLIAIPIMCLQINSFKKLGQLQSPFLHADALSDKITFYIPNLRSLNGSVEVKFFLLYFICCNTLCLTNLYIIISKTFCFR